MQDTLFVPVHGIISDGHHSIRNAVATAFPGIPHQLCHFHYLREAAKPVYEADRHAKKEATIQLLNKIINASPHITFHYSGDFDPQGLRIAAHLLARYPYYCQLWYFDPLSYFAALHISAANLDTSDRADLCALLTVFVTSYLL